MLNAVNDAIECLALLLVSPLRLAPIHYILECPVLPKELEVLQVLSVVHHFSESRVTRLWHW